MPSSLLVAVPWAGWLTFVTARGGAPPSESLASTLMTTGVFSTVLAASSRAVGAWPVQFSLPTTVTLRLNVTVVVVRPSLTRTRTVASPAASLAGVMVN